MSKGAHDIFALVMGKKKVNFVEKRYILFK
jgi:hypothetical protein